MAVVATGFFDGVHLGHRFVIETLVRTARERGEESIVVTFWPHPRNVLQDDARNLRLLSSLDEKKTMLKALGVDRVEVIRFTREFSALSTEQYLRDVVMDRFGATAVLLGYDNRMGRDSGGPDEIQKIAEGLGLDVVRTDRIDAGAGVTISSTAVRRRISDGDVRGAAMMLGYDYSLFGVVVEGNRLGRTIGFPTANMKLYEPLKLLPGSGAYLVRVETLGKSFFGMCNVGSRPTVNPGRDINVETNIFDFDEDIYGLDIRVTFIDKIRDEVRFHSVEELRDQLEKDRAAARDIASSLQNRRR